MKNSGISQKILMTAAELLAAWEDSDITLDALLDDLREQNAPERAAVADLLFEYFRHKGFIDNLIIRHAKKERVRQDMRLLISCAAVQLYFQTGIAQQSAVNIAVDCGKYLRGPGGGGFVNAMLRSFLRDSSFDPKKIEPALPQSLTNRWKTRFGAEETARLKSLFASNPALTFRLRDESAAEEVEKLGAVPLAGTDYTGKFKFYKMEEPGPLFSAGLPDRAAVYIQDPATALPLSLLDEAPQGYLLDACAAPGGKAIMLSDIINSATARLTVCDRSQKRLVQLKRNLSRAGVKCRSLAADATSLPFSTGTFDFILADVPCTNSGVYRRRPDAPWRFSPGRSEEAVKSQRAILNSLANQLKPGGQLLYSTCSIEPEEDDMQVENFLNAHKDFELVRSRTLLPDVDHDGAYAALLKRKISA